MFKTKKQFTEKSEEMRDRHNDSGRRYANNIRAGVNIIEIFDQLIKSEQRFDKNADALKNIQQLLKIRRIWLNVLLEEIEQYTVHTVEVNKYNLHKSNLILNEIKDFNKKLPELKILPEVEAIRDLR